MPEPVGLVLVLVLVLGPQARARVRGWALVLWVPQSKEERE